MKILQIMPADGWRADYLYQGESDDDEYISGELYSFPLIGFALVRWSELEFLQNSSETNPSVHGLIDKDKGRRGAVLVEQFSPGAWLFIGLSKK